MENEKGDQRNTGGISVTSITSCGEDWRREVNCYC